MSVFREHKEGQTYGKAWMYRWLIAILKRIDIRLLYFLMKICIIPFTLILSPGARIAFQYFRKQKHHGWWKSWCETYRNHVLFGETVIDKFAMYAGQEFKINYHGLDLYTYLTNKPMSFVQLSAHIGCSEIIGYTYNSVKPANVLVYGGENESLMKYRAKAFQKRGVKMILMGTQESHSADIVKALEKGEAIYAFADRVISIGRTIQLNYNGHLILVARGPLSIAATRGLDVVMASAMKEPDGSYTAFLTPLYYDKSANRHIQLKQLAEAYITEKRRLLDLYPLQWFNYTKITTKQN